MEFRILGPLEVRDGERTVELGAAKQRALLGLLLLHANELVTTTQLVDELWSDRPPATAEKLVQGYVHALRKKLGADVIVTRGPGYELRVEEGGLDVREFERLVAEAREAPLAEAVELRRRALLLWRGRPLADVAVDGPARTALARLEGLRLTTQLERLEGELELGRDAALVGELEPLAAAHPYEERAHALLMLALYRSGRQADALATYEALRRRLGDELGLQPSPELRDLQTAILRQDERLAAPPNGRVDDVAPAEPPGGGGEPPRRTRSGRSLIVVVGACAVALLAAAVVVTVARDGPAPVAVAPNSVAVIDPEQNRVVDAVAVGVRPGPLAAGASSVWVGNRADPSLTRIAIRAVEVVRNLPLPATPTGLAVEAGTAVWVAHGRLGRLSKVDSTFARVAKTIPVTRTAFGTSTGSVAFGFDAVWAVYGDSTLARIDPATVRRTGATFAGVGPAGITVGAGSVWVANGGESTVERFNPATFEEGPVRPPITVGNRPAGIAYGEGAVWVANAGDDTVGRIDPNSHSYRSIAVGAEPEAVAVGAGAVWVANAGDGTVTRIDPVTFDTREIEVGGAPAGIAVGGGRIWVAVQAP